MTDPIPDLPTVHIIVDHRAGERPELTAHVTSEAAYAAIGRAAVEGKGLAPGDVDVEILPVQGYRPSAQAGSATAYPIARPDWLGETFALTNDRTSVFAGSGTHLFQVEASGWSNSQDLEFVRYLVELVNADLAAARIAAWSEPRS